MKIYCSCCDKVQPVRIDNCRDAKTNEPFQDIVCAECDLVIAAGTDIVPPAQQQEPAATVVHTCKPGDYATIHTTVALQKGQTVYTSPQPSKPLTDEQPVSTADELPRGFVPLQKENGKLVYAACMDSRARHYKWLMWRHPDGQWVSKRKLEDWEVMQVEDQEHYGIVQEAAHGIKE